MGRQAVRARWSAAPGLHQRHCRFLGETVGFDRSCGVRNQQKRRQDSCASPRRPSRTNRTNRTSWMEFRREHVNPCMFPRGHLAEVDIGRRRSPTLRCCFVLIPVGLICRMHEEVIRRAVKATKMGVTGRCRVWSARGQAAGQQLAGDLSKRKALRMAGSPESNNLGRQAARSCATPACGLAEVCGCVGA